MSCNNVQELISSLLDRRISPEEKEDVLAHLESCRKCSARYETMQSLRTELRGMSQPAVPEYLHQQLRVIASHERVRLLARVSVSTRIRHWGSRMELQFNNMMRPLALPFAGGLLSALISFGLLVPNLNFQHNYTDEAFLTYPVGLVVEQISGGVVKAVGDVPRIEPVGTVNPEDANVVELTIDENGRVIDYSVSHGKLTPDLQSIIMFSQFQPATLLGLRTSGKVQIVQRLVRNVRS
jgi:hypothetical protein